MLTAAALLVVAVLFGGGGSRAGIANLVVQLAALIAIAFNKDAFFGFFKEAPRAVAALVAVTVLLPLVQCVPLPPGIWHQLPGRELAVEGLALIGQENSWMPFSVDGRRTLIAFLALMPPLATVVLSWRASADDRRFLLMVLVACAVAGILLGTLQLASGNRYFILYKQTLGSFDLQGTFANRNTVGLLTDVGLCCLIGLIWQKTATLGRLGVCLLIGALLLLGLFLTRSRSSMVLAAIPAVMFLIHAWNLRQSWLSRRMSRFCLIAILAAIGISAGLLGNNARIRASLGRFDTFQDARPAIWQDTQSSIERFWPLGSGIGTFDDVFQIDESLENLSPGRAARAHNEYLETTLESGLFGPLMIAVWVVTLARAFRNHFIESVERGPQLAALSAFLIFALQSILDYPLRSQAILSVAGLMVGFLIVGPAGAKNGEERLLEVRGKFRN